MVINESALMRIKIDYVENNIPLDRLEYKNVIAALILEVERLNASNVALRARLNNN